MSREKQIEEMAELIFNDTMCSGEKAIRSAEVLYNAGYSKQEWISVDVRLPEREGRYLVYTIKGGIKFGEYRSYLVGEGKLCEPQFDYYVTHWMPLPQPPKMKGGAE